MLSKSTWGWVTCVGVCVCLAGCGQESGFAQRAGHPPARRAKAADDRLPPPPEGMQWELVFHDEFEGDQLDTSKWNVHADGRRRDGWWLPEAITLDGRGHLVIRTLYKDGKYIDGCVDTRGKFERAFGYWVARIQFQSQPGHWSAFWLMGDGVRRVGDGGRDGTEIDIMEKPWLDNRVQHTLHWDGIRLRHRRAGDVADACGRCMPGPAVYQAE